MKSRTKAACKQLTWRDIALRAGVRTVILTVLAVVLMTGIAYAAGDPTGAATGGIDNVTAATAGAPTLQEVAGDVGHLSISMNVFFVIIGVALIFFMQAGFMLVETGFCRGKNAAHVAMTNFVIFAIGALAYWAVGFALQFGSFGPIGLLGGAQGVLDGNAFHLFGQAVAGTKGFFLGSLGDGTLDVGAFAFFLFQMVFMDTAATIVTGGMAERWKFSAFVPFGVYMAVFTYPLFGMWVWGGGWLAQLGVNAGFGHGVVDFAGSSVVHAVGGFSALAGALVIGPRIGKFKADGTPVAIPGHHIPMAILGTIILVFGWMGFNGMSTLSAGDLRFTVIIANTILAGSAGCLAAMFLVWKLWGHPDPSMSANGMLAGLVAITAPCAFVTPWAAVIIGIIAGLLVVGSVIFWERVTKIDDPVGAVSVHGVNGLWGMIALGLFADGTYGAGWNGVDGAVTGLFYGDGGQLIAQLIACVVVAAWAFGTMYVFFKIQAKTTGLRSSEADEIAGLDATEMGVLAYPDFAGSGAMSAGAFPEVPVGSEA
ncbi:MAG: ammonium transporter [Actinobacteria bacterium HGW-Actinobacteria-1]|nr:MAG: ammonium transporter [Actinobacteria bacterium HGW-Actinobacteria-1]